MLHDRSFYTAQEDNISKFENHEDLQQGLVMTRPCKAPLLFNIYNNHISRLHQLNETSGIHSSKFADDQIVCCAAKSPSLAAKKLQDKANQVNTCYTIWKLSLNPQKCETILFRLPSCKLNRTERAGWKDFSISLYPDSAEEIKIPHSSSVKYLSMQIDHILRMHEHLTTQLTKAKKCFSKIQQIFPAQKYKSKSKNYSLYNAYYSPIIIDASPTWFN